MIRMNKVCKSYNKKSGNIRVITDVTVKLVEGECCAIMGSSGSGKSTLLNIIGLLDNYDTGTFKLGQIDVDSLSLEQKAFVRNEKIGFIFQSFYLLSRLSAIDNVMLPYVYKGISQERAYVTALDMLDRVGLLGRADHKPEQLSGGQKQRVAIARALMGSPELILADEPTGNLDTTSAHQVLDLLLETSLDRGVTLVLVTHDSAIAARCDRQLIMRDGELCE